jgi:hypothetical protein
VESDSQRQFFDGTSATSAWVIFPTCHSPVLDLEMMSSPLMSDTFDADAKMIWSTLTPASSMAFSTAAWYESAKCAATSSRNRAHLNKVRIPRASSAEYRALVLLQPLACSFKSPPAETVNCFMYSIRFITVPSDPLTFSLTIGWPSLSNP